MSHTVSEINLSQWYVDRELKYCPEHFVLSNVPLTSERYVWVQEKLVGRFVQVAINVVRIVDIVPAFEDPSEMLFYELVWG
jgi:hypothetical protein